MPIKLLIVDDHDLVRSCIKMLLASYDEVEIVGEASNGEEALANVRLTKPDVILLDIMMPGLSGVRVLYHLQRTSPQARVIILTAVDSNAFPRRLLGLGAAGYITKDIAANELVKIIKLVHSGKSYVAPHIAEKIAKIEKNPLMASPFDLLTNREFEIMIMIISGHKVRYIATKLCLSSKTISSHRHTIFTKLGLNSDVELTYLAYKNGIIDTVKPVLEQD